jgi:hypothetical protein
MRRHAPIAVEIRAAVAEDNLPSRSAGGKKLAGGIPRSRRHGDSRKPNDIRAGDPQRDGIDNFRNENSLRLILRAILRPSARRCGNEDC